VVFEPAPTAITPESSRSDSSVYPKRSQMTSVVCKNGRQIKNGQDAKSKHRHCSRILRGQHVAIQDGKARRSHGPAPKSPLRVA
jgi:hypothetical protein